MFGKFGKKKLDEGKPETKTTRKNDLFTLLESSPEKSIESKDLATEKTPSSATSKPETTSKKDAVLSFS